MRNTALLLWFLAGCAVPVSGGEEATDGPPADAAVPPRDAGPPLPDAWMAPAPDLPRPAVMPDLSRPAGHGTLFGKATLTYYWLSEQSDYSGADDTVLCNVDKSVLAKVPLAFARALEIEGSGRLSDGRIVNVGGSCACSSGMTECYIVLDPKRYPWGMGAGSRALAPYRSVAVDPKQIPLDTHLYVPEFDGVQMPGAYGFVHDGCLVAADVGGHINGAHIDFFAAERANYLVLDGHLKLSSVTVYLNPPSCP